MAHKITTCLDDTSVNERVEYYAQCLPGINSPLQNAPLQSTKVGLRTLHLQSTRVSQNSDHVFEDKLNCPFTKIFDALIIKTIGHRQVF